MKLDTKFYDNKVGNVDIQGYIDKAKKKNIQVENHDLHEHKLSSNYQPFHVSRIPIQHSHDKRTIVASHLGLEKVQMEGILAKEVQDNITSLESSPAYQKDSPTRRDKNKTEKLDLENKMIKIVSKNYARESRLPNTKVLKTVTSSSNDYSEDIKLRFKDDRQHEYGPENAISKNLREIEPNRDNTLSGVGIKIEMSNLPNLDEDQEYRKKPNTAQHVMGSSTN